MRRVEILGRHFVPCPQQSSKLERNNVSTKLKVVRNRKGHSVPSDMKSSSAVVYMENDARKLTHGEKSKSLLSKTGTALLSTIHMDLDFPYGSVTNFALDADGHPYVFISTMAEHTVNLQADPRCSILVTEVTGHGDQLARSRLTLVGKMTRVTKDDKGVDYEELKSTYLQSHPAAYYVHFDDFWCFMMKDIKAVRYIGGFGEMSWVEPKDYVSSEVDPFFSTSETQKAVNHMNEDHADAVLVMTQAMGGLPEAENAVMLSLDRYGFDVLAETAEGKRRTRVAFKERMEPGDSIRDVVVEATNSSRVALGMAPKNH